MTTRDGRLGVDRRGHCTRPVARGYSLPATLMRGVSVQGILSPPFLYSTPRSDMMRASKFCVWLMVACSGLALPARAQGPNGNRPPAFASAEVSPERKVTFRFHAPRAEGVRLGSSDLPGVGPAAEMKKGDN